MKKTVLLFWALSITYSLSCQMSTVDPPRSLNIGKYKVIDESNLRITYSLDFKNSIQDKEYKKDTRIVQVGKRVIKDFSNVLYHYDSLHTELVKKGAQAVPGIPELIYPYEIFNHYEKGKCMLTYRTYPGQVLRYSEEQPNLKWELKEGSATILGYKCQKATTKFAGRSYIAWFTMELPINAGLLHLYRKI